VVHKKQNLKMLNLTQSAQIAKEKTVLILYLKSYSLIIIILNVKITLVVVTIVVGET